jgi:hypothetical protein
VRNHGGRWRIEDLCRDAAYGSGNRFGRNGSRGPRTTPCTKLCDGLHGPNLPTIPAATTAVLRPFLANRGPMLNLSSTVTAILLAASLAGITTPATAFADCGDPGQDPCTGPVPTVDEVVGILAELTDPDIPAVNKGDIVSPGFSPEEAGTIDDHLRRMNAVGWLPLPFDVTNIQPAPNNLAGATVAVPRSTPAGPIVLVDQGGHWLLTHHSAMSAMDAFWYNANWRPVVF